MNNEKEYKLNKKLNTAWIHLNDLRFFLNLGANPHEKIIGQNIKINLSLEISYENTEDKLEKTLDYGLVVEYLRSEIQNLCHTNLLEYLCEQLLNRIGKKFLELKSAKIKIEKGYVPLKDYTGSVCIEAHKIFER